MARPGWPTCPAGRIFTAERAAYRNLLRGLAPRDGARRHNPFREWIGALIRADVFGWVRPGDPYAAARLAWPDARLSHTRNGMYGASCGRRRWPRPRWWPTTSTRCSTRPAAVVPPGAGWPTAIAVRRRARPAADWTTRRPRLDRLHERYGHLHWVHVLNNAAIIACALDRGPGRLRRAIGFAVRPAGTPTRRAPRWAGCWAGCAAPTESRRRGPHRCRPDRHQPAGR